MEHDDRLSLADKFTGSNSDENDIDSDLENELYAAVFHANDVSSQSKDAPGDDNLTTRNSLKGTTLESNGFSKTRQGYPQCIYTTSLWSKSFRPLNNNQSFNCTPRDMFSRNKSIVQDSDSHVDVPDAYSVTSSSLHECGRNLAVTNEANSSAPERAVENCDNPIGGRGDLEHTDKDLQSGRKTGSCNMFGNEGLVNGGYRDPLSAINLFGDKLTSSESDTVYAKGSTTTRRENVFGSNKRSAVTRIMRKQKFLKKVAIPSSDDIPTSFVTQTSSVSLDHTSAENREERQFEATDERTCSFGDLTDTEEVSANRSATFRPEEQRQSVENESKGLNAHGEPKLKPKEQIENTQIVGNETLVLTNDSSLTNSYLGDASLNAPDEREPVTSVDNIPAGTEASDVIIIDDSDGSICEVPIPPRPKPPTINLDDSESSNSSDSNSSSEAMSPEKLIESYKTAVSKSNCRRRDAGGTDSDGTNRKKGHRNKSNSCNSVQSSHDDSTDSEEENWGIISTNQMNEDKSVEGSADGVRLAEVNEHSCNNVQPQSTTDLDLENNEASIPNDGSSALTDNVLFPPTHSDEITNLQQTEEAFPKNIGTQQNPGIFQNTVEDSVIINAETLQEYKEQKSLERKKRCMDDIGTKCMNQNSQKKVRRSDDASTSTSPGTKPCTENTGRKRKHKNCAADYFFKPMTNEMADYYNKSWGGENFDIDAIQREMPRDSRAWAISNDDLLGSKCRKPRYWVETKCRNCNRVGHNMTDCPEARKIPCCHMCGTPGHREPRCPHKMCLGCGSKQKTYMQVCNVCRREWCSGCRSYGHERNHCPDLWRRYHMTTRFKEMNTHLTLADVMKPSQLLSCCNCAKRGHDSSTCGNYRWSRHFPTPSFVTNYTTGPSYADDIALEEAGFPPDAEAPTEREKNQPDTVVSRPSTSNSEGKKITSDLDKGKIPDQKMYEMPRITSTQVLDVQKVNRDRSSSLQRRQSGNKLLPRTLRTTIKGESLLIIDSQLLDTRFTSAANFCEHTFPMTVEQYEDLINADVSLEFLENLASQFPIKLKIKRCQSGITTMTIASTKDLHLPLQQIIDDWLHWPIDERSRFIHLNLPTAKGELLKLLSSKLNELKQDLGNPVKLNESVQSLKDQLRSLQQQTKTGKIMGTCSKRARVVEELANLQCRLNMILFGQASLRKCQKSRDYLNRSLRLMKKKPSPTYICAATYLNIVHHYNIIFAAYTPRKMSDLINLYIQKYSKGFSKKKKQSKSDKCTDAYNNFLKILHGANVTSEKNLSPTGFNVNADTSGVEAQFQTPNSSFKDVKLNLSCKFSPTPLPLMYDLDRLENNYHNSQYAFGDKSHQERQRSTDFLYNVQQNEYVATDYRTIQNNHYNVENDMSRACPSFSKHSRIWHEHIALRINQTKQLMENGHFSVPGTDGASTSVRKYRYDLRNVASQHVYFDGNDVECAAEEFHSNDQSVVPRTKDVNISKHDESVPSTSGLQDSQNVKSKSADQDSAAEHHKSSHKSKKKSKKKSRKLPLYLQKRAIKNIAKFTDIAGHPRVTQAATELQRKLSNKEGTLQCVKKFESLVKHKLKKTEYLL